MSRDTWADTTAETVADEPQAVAIASATGPGRMTVLPRVEDDGGETRLVQDERPRFEVTERLGQGGLGEVVGATDLDIGRRVAIKRIREDRHSRAAFLRFVQEVRTVGRLDHPGIVPIHDVGRDEQGDYYFVMKFVDGETLEDVIAGLRAGDASAHARWPYERRVDTFHRLLYSVAYAHERGVIHRDIKPANVMIGSHGEVQLLDWGIAKVVGAPEVATDGASGDPASSVSVTHTRAGALIGTPRYMSPEQTRGEPVDARTDTWALSLLLYEWLTLEHPFEAGQSVDAVLEAVRSTPLPNPQAQPIQPVQGRVPADLGWYVFDGLHKAPGERYQTVGQMIDRLERRAEGDIPVQCPVTLQKVMLLRSGRLLDRHPVAYMALLMASLGTGILGLAALVAGIAVGFR